MHDIRYRSDIDGLRAVAVVPVILFHMGLPFFGGGYVGVDVFFVISGFLITSVIEREIADGRFSILSFYERRARRILPALFATAMATIIAGWFLFLPDQFRKLGSRVVAVVLFASNVLFWKQADYFSGPVDMEPLLHTWSLAVEEQFYIFWPIGLLLLTRFGGGPDTRRLRIVVIAVTLVSFALSVALINVDRTADYYLLPTRAWELLAGAVLAIGAIPAIRRRLVAETAAAGGLLLILGSAVLLSRTSVFPGVNAIWPVLGSAAIIHAGTGRTTIVGRWLGARPLAAIGLISYSLYLVHWPLIVYVKYQLLRDPTPVEIGVMLAATLALATLSWRFVERPFRNRHVVGRRAIFAGSLAAAGLLMGAGLAMYRTNGVPSRFPGIVPQTIDKGFETGSGPSCFRSGHYGEQWGGAACFLTPSGAGPNTLLWGDSHANQYRGVLHDGVPVTIPGLLLYAAGGCLPIFDVDIPERPSCRADNDRVLAIIRQYRIGTVILSGDWEYIMHSNDIPVSAVARTVQRLRGMGVRVKMIGDNPFYAFSNPGYLGYRLSLRADPKAPYYTRPANDWSINPALRDVVGAAWFFDPVSVLCRPADRQCLVYDEGQLVMEDTGHLSVYGRKLVARRMAAFLTR